MDIGLVKDRRPFEHRIGLTPGGVNTLTSQGHRVYIESDAGIEAGFTNEEYRVVGAEIAYSEEEVLLRTQMIVRVSPPQAADYGAFQPGQVVISSWHLALASQEGFNQILDRKITTVGFEIIEEDDGHAPVLEAMGEIAGRIAVIIGSGLLLNEFGGKGLLIGGAPGIPPASLCIVGAGKLGIAATRAARGINAHVVVLDRDVNALRRLQSQVGTDVPTMVATPLNLKKAMAFSDLCIFSVSVHGEKAPILVTRDMLRLMKPRSIIMDLSIDQGGCCETSHPTDFSNPTFTVDDIIHFCVPNLPSTASRASTRSLTNAILPYVVDIANKGFDKAVRSSHAINRGTYTFNGTCPRKGLATTFGVPYEPIAAE